MQPYLFPYLGYFQHINAVSKFIILDDVHFIKKGYINRNQILLNGKEHRFTFPLQKVSQNKLIHEVELQDEEKDRLNFLNVLKQSYSKAPYFKAVFPIIEELVLLKELNLSNFLANSIKGICDYLRITTEIVSTSRVYDKKNLKGQDRILDIVRQNSGTTYINPTGGMGLYDTKTFRDNGISLKFHKMNDIVYNQFSNDFIAYLSIIDVMMFNSPGELSELLNQYSLIDNE